MAVRDPGEAFGAAWNSPHAGQRWRDRAGRGSDNLLARWHEAVPVEAPQAPQRHADARAHVPTDTLLIARWGEIQTVLRIDQCPDPAERAIRAQLPETPRRRS